MDRLLGLGSSRCVARGVDSAQVAQMEVRPDWGGRGVLTRGAYHPRSRSGSAGRVALSREDKEAAKLGLSVFTVSAHNTRGSRGSGSGAGRLCSWGTPVPRSGKPELVLPVGIPGRLPRTPPPPTKVASHRSTIAWTVAGWRPLRPPPGRSLGLRTRRRSRGKGRPPAPRERVGLHITPGSLSGAFGSVPFPAPVPSSLRGLGPHCLLGSLEGGAQVEGRAPALCWCPA